MLPVLLLAAAASALLAIACEERATGRHPAFFLLKPLTTALILGAAWFATGADPTYRNWIVAGLALSLCGDVALMFAGNAAFMAGLGSFLFAHVLFVVAFLLGGLGMPHWGILAPLLAGGVFAWWLLPKTGELRIPVAIYVLALVAMALASSSRYALREDLSGLLAAVGSVVFLLSDAALSGNQFQGVYRRAQALILSTYFLAIGLIAASVAGSG